MKCHCKLVVWAELDIPFEVLKSGEEATIDFVHEAVPTCLDVREVYSKITDKFYVEG